MAEQKEARPALLTWVAVAAAVAVAGGWYVDRSQLSEAAARAQAERDVARDRAKQAATECAPVQQELKLTKQALIDADDTRERLGARIQECEARAAGGPRAAAPKP